MVHAPKADKMNRHRFKIDSAGTYHALSRSKDYPDTYSITVYLKEALKSDILQQAVNDTMKRIPTANVSLKHNFFGVYHEEMSTPPQIEPAENNPIACDYYSDYGEHQLRVLYGENFFTLEVMHSVCDGRGLTQILKCLTTRYFELLDVHTDKANPTDIVCGEPADPEESENALARHGKNASTPKAKSGEQEKVAKSKDKAETGMNTEAGKPEAGVNNNATPDASSIKTAYRLPVQPQQMKTGLAPTPLQTFTQVIDLASLKSVAKEHGASINEYLLTQIFLAMAEERKEQHAKEKQVDELPIVATIPVDARNFLPSKTLLNFVIDKRVVMPEGGDEVLQSIRDQFTAVDKDFILEEVTWIYRGMKLLSILPKGLQTLFTRLLQRIESRKCSTMFSNLGLVKLPPKIEDRIQMMEFVIGRMNNIPYHFTCITVGNVLTLTTASTVPNCTIAQRLHHRITQD